MCLVLVFAPPGFIFMCQITIIVVCLHVAELCSVVLRVLRLACSRHLGGARARVLHLAHLHGGEAVEDLLEGRLADVEVAQEQLLRVLLEELGGTTCLTLLV